MMVPISLARLNLTAGALAILVPMGVGAPPSWEKAAMDGVMCAVLATCGGGLLSLDNLIIADMLKNLIG